MIVSISRLVAASGTSFLWPFLRLDAERRQAFLTLYAFFRVLDDACDAARPAAADAALTAWREEVERMFTGCPRHPLTCALLGVIRRYHLPRAPFDAMLEGMAMDGAFTTAPPTEAQLKRYCECVAASVGQVCLPVLGVRIRANDALAWHLGIAMQLTNILRDHETDLVRGRVYYPEGGGGGWQRPRRRMGSLAYAHYAKACALMRRLPKKQRQPVEDLYRVYFAQWRRMQQVDWRVLTRCQVKPSPVILRLVTLRK